MSINQLVSQSISQSVNQSINQSHEHGNADQLYWLIVTVSSSAHMRGVTSKLIFYLFNHNV